MRFDPLLDKDGVTVSKSPWGPTDEIGRLNLMTPETQAAVLARIDGSQIFDLSVTYFMGMPSWSAAHDPKYDIWTTHTPHGSVNDDLTGAGPAVHEKYSYAGSAITMYSHIGTHLCSLNHLGHYGRFWNGWSADSHLGSRAWTVGGVCPPIISQAKLLDVARAKGMDCLPDSYPITVDDLDLAAESNAIQVEAGDVVLIRTGRMTRWPDREAFLKSPPGLGLAAARHLCEVQGVMCLGLDVGGEALPPETPDTFLPVHAYLFATAGCPLFENLWLEDLAASPHHTVAFLAFPLKLKGSTGMPVRPVAIPLTQM
jgi:kynurenine formamidase